MALVGTGAMITFSTGFFAEILSITGPGASRISIPTSHMGTTSAHTFTPGDLVDWGEVRIEMAFNPATTPPITGVPETMTITFPDSGAATWAASGFMTAFEPSTPLEDRCTATATIKLSGAVTIAP